MRRKATEEGAAIPTAVAVEVQEQTPPHSHSGGGARRLVAIELGTVEYLQLPPSPSV